MRLGEIRFDRERLAVALDRRVELALIFERKSPGCSAPRRIIRFDRERLVVALDRRVELALISERSAQVAIH